mgnify:CR=1 FL=1
MWVARDKDGELFLYTKKPYRYAFSGMFVNTVSGKNIRINDTLFPNLKWENKPLEVNLVESFSASPRLCGEN